MTSSPSTYTWNRESPQSATWYQVEIDGPGGNLLSKWYRAKSVCSGSSCSVSEQLNLGEGSYSWRARGRNPAGRSAWSADLDFSIQPPPAPTLTLKSGSCGATVEIDGKDFPPNSEVGVVMASGSSGWTKSGTLCNGTSFEMSEPFVLPPTWVITNSAGSFTVQMTGEKCFVQSLALKTCEVSNLLILP